MITRRIYQIMPILIAIGLLIFVWSVPIENSGGWATFWSTVEPSGFTYRLFQLAGLTAFTLISFQVATGPYMKLWERLYGSGFYKFHAIEGLSVLLFALLHPLLLGVYLLMEKIDYRAFASGYPFQLYFGPLALTLLLVTIPSAAATILWSRPQFRRNWHWIHLANYLVFLLIFLHSLSIGSDVSPPDSRLRPLWWTFFALWVAGLVYRRIIRVQQEGKHGLDQ